MKKVLLNKFFDPLFCAMLFFLLTGSLISQNLSLPAGTNWVSCGDIDVNGNQITVEAMVYYTGGVNIISKHTGPPNVNYLLRPGTFEITTSSGFSSMANPYTLTPNQWYHLAGTYDGTTVKYYVNGCLVVQKAWTGNLVVNNYATAIGNQSNCQCEPFTGDIDEVRIWDIARTQVQIQANMTNLPNPTTTPNLLAYYQFNGNYINNQGNAAFNGTPVGAPQLVNNPAALPAPFAITSILNTNVACFGGSTGSSTVSAVNSTFSIDGTNFQASGVFTGLPAANYTFYAKSPEGCLLSSPTTITEPAQLTATSTFTNVQCFGQSNGAASVVVSGGTPAYTYVWSPSGGNGATASSLAAGSYTCSITDNNLCNTIQVFTITQPTLPVISANNATICAGVQAATLTATGALTYSWIPSSGLSSTNSSVVIANPGTTTTYSVGGIDINGCANYTTATVVVNSLPIITVNSASICLGQQTATLTATGATSYTWTPAASLSSSTGQIVTATPGSTTTYSIVGTDTNGCPNFTTTQIVVNPTPTISVNSATICQGIQTATLNASGAASYTWSPVTGLSSGTGSTVAANPITSTTYTITGATTIGCTGINTATVTVNPLPVLSANNASICIGQQTATLTVSGALTYSWIPSSGLSSSTNPVVVANPAASTTYSVVGINIYGCPNYTTATVVVNPLPIITVNNASICLGQQTANLNAGGAFTYSWSPTTGLSTSSGAAVVASPTINTNYTVTGIDVNGCVNSKAASVTIYPIPVVALTINTNTICIGSPVIITPSGANSYLLLPDNLTSASAYTLNPINSTVYSIIGTSINNCVSVNTASVNLTVFNLPNIMAQSDATLNIGQTTTLTANGGITYSWNPAYGLSCPACPVTNANPYSNTMYIVSGTDINGCVNIDTVFIKVDYVCADFFMPNAFSPNGDGLNDMVNLHGACISSYNLQIFNRWGEMVFETTSAESSWDGSFRGKALDTGVFVYRANGITLDGTPFNVKGNVTLIR